MKSKIPMPQFFPRADEQGMISSNSSHVSVNGAVRKRFSCFVAGCLLTLCWLAGAHADGQIPSDTTPAQSAQSTAGDGSSAQTDSGGSSGIGFSGIGQNASPGLNGLAPHTALSADQITNILQQ